MIYGELKRIGATYLRRERSDHTLQPTDLINEAYMKMIGITHFILRRIWMIDHISFGASMVGAAAKR